MITGFRDKEAEKIFQRYYSRVLPFDIQKIAYRKLLILDAACILDDLMAPPGNRLEKLQGKRIGQWSIRINDQWRVCFFWKKACASDVEIIDYHR